MLNLFAQNLLQTHRYISQLTTPHSVIIIYQQQQNSTIATLTSDLKKPKPS